MADLAGWGADDHAAALEVFLSTADHLTDGSWQAVVAAARRAADPRLFFETMFSPTAPRSTLFTGYFEPELPGARVPGAGYETPLYRLPPFPVALSRRDIIASGALAGYEICWLRTPLDLFFLQVQGSGRIRLPDGETLRVNFAGSNGRPYTSIGAALVARGAVDAADISAQAIRAWASTHPGDLDTLLNLNESYVFFRDVTAQAGQGGPLGALGRPVTALRSLAVDPVHVPLAVPVWVETFGPQPIRRLMVAQDTGAAIKGGDRADIFFGTGQGAGDMAGRLLVAGRMAVLMPRVGGVA